MSTRRYGPLGDNGQKFLHELNTYVAQVPEVSAEELTSKIHELEAKWKLLFSSHRWVGCQGSQRALRGFSCGLWTLFHHLTVQAANTEASHDPLEVLQAVHGYVKYFFGCSDCSSHFTEMAAKNKIWNVPNKDDAILWLWSAHNEVNQRLAGDSTEDPVFPKIQFPDEQMCSQCYRTSSANRSGDSDGTVNWDKNEVLFFLKRIHSPVNISRLGVDDESVLPESFDGMRPKRQTGNVFTDMDLRMGMFLYVFCMGIIVLAVKLFMRRGYRKKIYFHDFLGKV